MASARKMLSGEMKTFCLILATDSCCSNASPNDCRENFAPSVREFEERVSSPLMWGTSFPLNLSQNGIVHLDTSKSGR
jgi:hypothetical protein